MNFQECNGLNLRRSAEIYRGAGMKITPLKQGTKEAYKPAWNLPEARDKYTADYWNYHPSDNIGLLLYASGIVVLDIDDLPAFIHAMEAIGLNHEYNGQPPFYRTATAGIKSGAINKNGNKKAKLIFKRPEGMKGDRLTYHSLNWNDADGKGYTVFELRTGTAQKDIQDVLPPSIHPDTGKPYQWIGGDVLPMPEDLFILWAEWDLFEPDLIKADPNYQPAPLRIPRPKRAPKAGELTATEIIEAWNNCHTIGELLERHGYTHAYGDRYLSPHSTSGNPGIIINTAENTAHNFGASDPLSLEHTIRPFDVLLHYEYGGRIGDAVKAIKEELGLSSTNNTGKKSAPKGSATTGNNSAGNTATKQEA